MALIKKQRIPEARGRQAVKLILMGCPEWQRAVTNMLISAGMPDASARVFTRASKEFYPREMVRLWDLSDPEDQQLRDTFKRLLKQSSQSHHVIMDNGSDLSDLIPGDPPDFVHICGTLEDGVATCARYMREKVYIHA